MKKQLININPVKDKVKRKLLEKYDETTFMNTNRIELKIDIEDILNEHIEELNLVEPTIYIVPEAYLKMRMLVDKTDTEIAWYGIVENHPGLPNTYVITDILVYPQKVTGATVEQDESRMFEFEMSLTTEQVNHKRFQGHSHVNMGTTPSSVDENFYQDLLSQVTDYFIITVTNKRNEYTTRFYDVANNILYTEVPIQLINESGFNLLDWYDEQKEQLTKPVTSYSKYGTPIQESFFKSSKSTTKNKFKKDDDDDDDDDFQELIWDPNIYDYVSHKDYEDI